MKLIVAWMAALAALCGSAAPAEMLALTNARIIDGTGAPPQPARTVLIEDGVISAVLADGEQALPADARVVDLGGRTLLPGLIDGHVHLFPVREREQGLRALLRSGVTSVRELAGDARISGDLARRAAAGEIEAPAIHFSAVMAGPLFFDDPRPAAISHGFEPGTAPWAAAVTAQSDLPQLVRAARATGASAIKLYASLEAPLAAALIEEAHRQGMRVWSHSVLFPARPGEIVAAGPDAIIHARGLIAEGRPDLPDTYAEGTRVWIRRQDFAGTDVEEPRFAALFAEMRRRGVIFEPALHADGDPADGPTGDWRDPMRDWSCSVTGAAYRAGVTISAGTDTGAVPGALHRELGRLVECGLTPLDAIRAATLANAAALGIDRTHGSVRPGRAADLLVVDGDPATDIADISRVWMVIKDGRIMVGPEAAEREAEHH